MDLSCSLLSLFPRTLVSTVSEHRSKDHVTMYTL